MGGAGDDELMPDCSRNIPLAIAWFNTAKPPLGEAIGILSQTTWHEFIHKLSHRRQGEKDGPCFASAIFDLKPDGIHVGRKKTGALARTAIVLDVETSKLTGEIPPSPDEALRRARALGLATLVYTSHNHQPDKDLRYRVVIPLSDEIACEIPAPEIMAAEIGLAGVMDASKIGPASLFYAPSCPAGAQNMHYFEAIEGTPVDADSITDTGLCLLRARKVQEKQIAAEAQAHAAARRAAKIATGFDPDDNLIEKIRVHLDLEQILISHGYDRKGPNFRHPNSSSGFHGANVKILGGIHRIFSHNATDPLHESNLPAWCGKVTALDAFDVTAILDYGGDRKRALRSLSEKFNLTKAAERKALAGLLFRLIKMHTPQKEIENRAFAEGRRLGLSRDDVTNTFVWVADQTSKTA